MITIHFQKNTRVDIETQAAQNYPDEACGLLIGEQINAMLDVFEVFPSDNINRTSRKDGYEVDPKAMISAEQRARERGLQVIGVWHSHPDYLASPSEADRVAAWPQWSYVIVSVMNGVVMELRAWRLNAYHNTPRFEEERIYHG